MDALCGRTLELYKLPAAARASFIFTFCSAPPAAPEALPSQRLRVRVRSSLWKEPQLPGRERRARDQSAGNPGLPPGNCSGECGQSSNSLWLRSRAGWPFGSGVTSQALSCRAHLGTGDSPKRSEPPQRVARFAVLSECWAHTSP